MKRSQLRQVASEVRGQLSVEPVSYWLEKEYPWTFAQVVDGRTIEVEVDLLERSEEHMLLTIAVSSPDNLLSSFFPVSVGLTVNPADCANKAGGGTEDNGDAG